MILRFLTVCRYLLVLPVVGCVVLTLGAMLMGLGRIVTSAANVIAVADVSAKAAKIMALAVIEIIDLFLVGTVAYITAMGLYKLFIADEDVELPMRLKIRNLKDLEDKIIGVIVAALAVAFLGQAAGTEEPTGILAYGAGIAAVIAALAFFIRQDGSKPPTGSEDR
jgi:uncharacterized membrane protein YqhA